MKRFHVHAAVGDLDQSVEFYTEVFGSRPSVLKADYAKWMLDDPRLNFAISRRGVATGILHLGIQVENQGELEEVYGHLRRTDRPVWEEGATICCYAQGEKSWIEDPQWIRWEIFLTTGDSTVYGRDPVGTEPVIAQAPCCALARCPDRAA